MLAMLGAVLVVFGGAVLFLLPDGAGGKVKGLGLEVQSTSGGLLIITLGVICYVLQFREGERDDDLVPASFGVAIMGAFVVLVAAVFPRIPLPDIGFGSVSGPFGQQACSGASRRTLPEPQPATQIGSLKLSVEAVERTDDCLQLRLLVTNNSNDTVRMQALSFQARASDGNTYSAEAFGNEGCKWLTDIPPTTSGPVRGCIVLDSPLTGDPAAIDATFSTVFFADRMPGPITVRNIPLR
jgi:hypothetical protein